MLVGPTAGGKTTVRKLLRHALVISDGVSRVDGNNNIQVKVRIGFNVNEGLESFALKY